MKLFREDREEMTFPEICNFSGLNKSTVFRLLSTLEKHGFVAINPEGKYYLGYEIMRLSTLLSAQQNVRNKAHDVMHELTRHSGETVILTLLDANTLTCIDKIESDNTLTITSRLGAVLPLFHGATGRAVSAYFTSKQLEHYLRQEERRLERAYQQDTLIYASHDVTRSGYCISEGEVDAAVVAIAAPFFGSQRAVLGSISIVGPSVRFDRNIAQRHAEKLLEATAIMSSRFGYTESRNPM